MRIYLYISARKMYLFVFSRVALGTEINLSVNFLNSLTFLYLNLLGRIGCNLYK